MMSLLRLTIRDSVIRLEGGGGHTVLLLIKGANEVLGGEKHHFFPRGTVSLSSEHAKGWNAITSKNLKACFLGL